MHIDKIEDKRLKERQFDEQSAMFRKIENQIENFYHQVSQLSYKEAEIHAQLRALGEDTSEKELVALEINRHINSVIERQKDLLEAGMLKARRELLDNNESIH